jgi:hypothetical protein
MPTLSTTALDDLAAGGTPPEVPTDPTRLTTDAMTALLALVKYTVSYGGRVIAESPYILATPPEWADKARWYRGAAHHLALVTGLELDGEGKAIVDGWIVTVGGAE